MPPMRVLISGAGIAGPALAWFLAKTGARITVVEKASSLLPHGQNVDITGSAITAVKKMGLMTEFRKYHTKECGTQLIDLNGKPFAPFPIKEGSTASFTSEFEILRGDLAKLFYEATKDHPNVNYLFGTTISKIISNDDVSVKVELSNGDMHESDLLVAADGQWSKVRKQVFPKEDITVVDKDMYVVYYTIPRLPIDNDWWNVYGALRSRVITLRPDPHGTIRAMFMLMPCNKTQKQAWQEASRSDRKTQQELVRREFADAGWQTQRFLDAMDSAPDFYFQACQQIKMKDWSKSRIVCVGDAAYAPTPLTGAGTTLAITGAYILAGELCKLEDGEHPSKALEAFENTFKPFVEQVQSIPFFIPAIAFPTSAWKIWVLQSCLSALSKFVATSWFAKRFGRTPESNDDGFPLPAYPDLDKLL
ncbi:related to salicylate 1-monooxygenase [Phialocephala subalpina]|uniref:Related to salicylate 1-monooxygenase n=1 Tax=Phialocephala subalpina TaxID=576137 RepID=A0A1L7WG61_9HELO|nr:related to salicylate 1-monooxygenase [Phialocephala subalpina]